MTIDGEAVVRAANSTPYGLGGSVWSSDPGRAARMGDRLEVGNLWINAHKALAMHQPFGGVKWSGIGLENGIWGLDSFTDLQTHYEAR
jgi:acyl-CoA reductase-like NAD-dependent aldehyde dehydrogenase